jgi:aminopeptidase-like protein
MTVAELLSDPRTDREAGEMKALVGELYPIPRSITGEGLRRTLQAIGRRIPLRFTEVPSGTPVLDWTIPNEWNVADAYVANTRGDRVIDFRASNLHLVGYSVPIRRRVPIAELKEHLFSLPDHPDWIPYRTSYYQPNWGFCATRKQLESLTDPEYDVVIDTTLTEGSLTYAECLLPGETGEEVLLSCHACHPSLANDNLSGIALATSLARLLDGARRRYTYRFLFAPGTIGAIAWLARNEEALRRIRAGLVIACVGDAGPIHYKKSRRGDAAVDRAAAHVLRASGRTHRIVDFSPYGYDERQYCSPGFDLPVGSLTRTPHGRFPEYHTSADRPDFVHAESLGDSLRAYLEVLAVLEGNGRFVNLSPKGEPQLGRRGLYEPIGGLVDPGKQALAMLWVLNLSDGRHDLLEIADRSDLPFAAVRGAADRLVEIGLLAPAPE